MLKSIIQQFKAGCNFRLFIEGLSRCDHLGVRGYRVRCRREDSLLTPVLFSSEYSFLPPLYLSTPHSVLSLFIPLTTKEVGKVLGALCQERRGVTETKCIFLLTSQDVMDGNAGTQVPVQKFTRTSDLIIVFSSAISEWCILYGNVLCYSLYFFICLKYFLSEDVQYYLATMGENWSEIKDPQLGG